MEGGGGGGGACGPTSGGFSSRRIPGKKRPQLAGKGV